MIRQIRPEFHVMGAELGIDMNTIYVIFGVARQRSNSQLDILRTLLIILFWFLMLLCWSVDAFWCHLLSSVAILYWNIYVTADVCSVFPCVDSINIKLFTLINCVPIVPAASLIICYAVSPSSCKLHTEWNWILFLLLPCLPRLCSVPLLCQHRLHDT